jgi:nucleotide-binding universal stress UspA family protein
MAPTPTSGTGLIIVGVERSERSRDALALGRTLARAVGAELLLVSAYPVAGRSAVMPPAAYATALVEEAEATFDWVARPLLNGVPTRSRAVPCTSVARGLHDAAEDEGALAIVVGPSHRGPVGSVIPGSVGDRLLDTAPCPVAVAPNGYRSAARPIRHIGVGFLATPEADEALGAAVGIAARAGAAVEVLSVVELPSAVALGYAWGYGKSEQTARDDLSASLASTIDDVGSLVEIDGKVVDGYADDELARLSAEVDLLICGSRRLGRLRRVMVGSVSAGVLRKARCPVLVVPRGALGGLASLQIVVPRGTERAIESLAGQVVETAHA